jgi:nucleotide-binding universal stress UspA family protein
MSAVIVGVDDSATARRAATIAASLATALDTPLHVLSVVTKRKNLDVSAGGEHWHTNSVDAAEQLLAALKGELSAPSITYSVSSGDPATELVAEADRIGAAIIVVGNRRVQGMARVLGAIATDVARHASCDVYIANTTS